MILVAGEALFDLVVDDSGTVRAHAGGAAFNTARTIGRLGEPVGFLGRLSTDRFGTTLRHMLVADGVEMDAALAANEPTTLALVEVDRSANATFRFYEEDTAAPGLTPEAARAVLPEDVDILHVGCLGLVLEPMADALEAVVEDLSGKALVVVDPNVRPWAITDPESYRQRLRRVIARSDVVKVSDDDLAWLDPERDPVAWAGAVLAEGVTAVLLTRGADGVLVITATATTPVAAPAAQIVDTIGAGDAFIGGFLAWWDSRNLGSADLANHNMIVEAARFGALVAARTCEHAGASPPFLGQLG